MPDPVYAIFATAMLLGYSLVFVAFYLTWNRKLRKLKQLHGQQLKPPSKPHQKVDG